MEKQALAIMKPQIKRIEHYPEMADRLQMHVHETEQQIERLDTILNDMLEKHSGIKDMMLSMGGSMAALSHAVAGDEILKDAFANYAFEHYEIAAYISLTGLCDATGAQNAVSLLEQNLNEERSMASWIEEHIVPTTLRFIDLSAAEETAKR
ncbi:ferritin-like domain-containing protein [Pelagibacterium luteolum]|uniref:Ferritin-like metal-binding protein YciE n=1 Tax=Pelagibacterium luteolum TaxID=440168 RepID=A0A1G8A516_9HYPH|nr:ferritin-like domain-containing protein [Pelagibacterium luteolum]SDH16029.1 Ferritin-like metal-binding protein YciE [Pelagibacterium luteolum]